MPTMMVKIVVVVKDRAIAWPMSQSIPPSKKNQPTLPAWKDSCVLTCCRVPFVVSANSENPITILPTIARQVDTDAISPIRSATPSESLSPIDGRNLEMSILENIAAMRATIISAIIIFFQFVFSDSIGCSAAPIRYPLSRIACSTLERSSSFAISRSMIPFLAEIDLTFTPSIFSEACLISISQEAQCMPWI